MVFKQRPYFWSSCANQYCFWNALKKRISELGPSPWSPKMVYEHPQDVTCYHFWHCSLSLAKYKYWSHRTLRRIWKIAPPHQSVLAQGNKPDQQILFCLRSNGVSWKSNMLTDLDRTQFHVWLVNIAKSMWQRAIKVCFCTFTVLKAVYFYQQNFTFF